MNIEQLVPEQFSGIVFVKKGKKQIMKKAYGYADIPNNRPNELNTKFVTASAGKAFTATGILKLIDAGKLNFDSTIGELLDFDLKDIDPKITVHQLLTHTSGIPDYCDETLVHNYADIFLDYPNYKIRTSKDMIPLFQNMQMTYPRGEKFHYNNTGYVVLGLIIEAITGLPFDEYLKEKIFLPCDMKDTGYFEYDRLPANCATVYIYDEKRKEYYTNIYSTTAKGVGDGGVFTTVDDIEKFWHCLYKGDILGKETLELMTKPQTPEKNYGYGLWLKELDGRYIPHFEGCEPGIGFITTYNHVKELLVTLVVNKDYNVWKLNRDIMKFFL